MSTETECVCYREIPQVAESHLLKRLGALLNILGFQMCVSIHGFFRQLIVVTGSSMVQVHAVEGTVYEYVKIEYAC